MKKLLLNILTMCLSLLILLGVLEVFVRLFVPAEYYQFTSATREWTGDKLLGWKNKPNFETETVSFGKTVLYKTNIDGFRPYTATREKKEGVIRVMLFGNSTVTARDVPEKQVIHSYLDSMLDLSGRNYEVINAGVLGYATDQSLLNIERQIAIYHPDIVCYGYCINDLYANMSHDYSGLHKPIFKIQGDSLSLELPDQFNEDILDATSTYSLRDIIQYSAFYGLLRPYIQNLRIKLSKQEELDQGGVGDIEKYENPIDKDPHLHLLSLLLKRMDAVCEGAGADFLFYAHPEVVTVWPPYREAIGKQDIQPHIIENKLKEIADRQDIEFVGLVDHFLENQSSGPFHLLPRDPHCNNTGYLLQSEVLSEYILGMTQVEHDSTLQRFLQ